MWDDVKASMLDYLLNFDKLNTEACQKNNGSLDDEITQEMTDSIQFWIEESEDSCEDLQVKLKQLIIATCAVINRHFRYIVTVNLVEDLYVLRLKLESSEYLSQFEIQCDRSRYCRKKKALNTKF